MKNKTKNELIELIAIRDSIISDNKGIIEMLKSKLHSLDNKLYDKDFELRQKEDHITKLKIDNIATLKAQKLLFTMIENEGHTHREKNRLVRLAKKVIDDNISELENEISISKVLPF